MTSRWITRGLAAAFALVALFVVVPAFAAFTPPPLRGHVVDTSGKLSGEEVLALDQKLDAVRQTTGFEIVAFLVGSLEGETIEDVAYESFNAWGLGRSGKDNGVLLILAPAERKVRIETGKGVGGALTDLQSNDIIRQVIGPRANQGRFRDAVDEGASAIAQALVQGSPDGAAREPLNGRPEARAPLSAWRTIGLVGLGVLVLLLAIISPGFRQFLFFMLLFVGRGGRGGRGGGGSGYSGGGGRSGGGGSTGSF